MGFVVYSETCGPGKYCCQHNGTLLSRYEHERDVKKGNFRGEFHNIDTSFVVGDHHCVKTEDQVVV